MCAISGVVYLHTDDKINNIMLKTMLRRGPDDTGVYKNGPCTLLHARLAVIDPVHGKQPMSVVLHEQTYSIVYNGELYNTAEVRKELEALGHDFVTRSDTEVVLHAYVQWKEAALEKLNGIFAFAVWEDGAKRLFLARDRMGVKPLFYKLHEDGLVFASEIKTILSYPTVKAELDQQGAAEILLLGPGRMEGSGVFRGVEELEPGSYAYYSERKLSKTAYWKLRDADHTDTFSETVEKVRNLVLDSVRRQMISDVPIGTFLSGGLDSSILSAVCAHEFASRGEILQTFSVDYTDNDKYFVPNKFQPNSDGHYIRTMENFLRSNHHWTILNSDDLLNALEDATIARDLPGMADVDFSLLVFCKEIRKSVKVALSGECADEIFGGYPWYRDPLVRAKDGFPWAQNTASRKSFLHPEIAKGMDAEDFVHSCYQNTIQKADILPGTSALERRMKEMVNLNFHWFMQTLLDRKDRMSMYSGLEVRVPFCDYRIAEYLYTVPWEYKDYMGMEKGLLRTAMEGLLPDEVLYRKKSPYPKTYDPRYLQLVSSRLQAIIDDPQAPIHQIVCKQALQSLLTDTFEWPWYGQLMRVPQTIAYMLQINFWLQHYHISVV